MRSSEFANYKLLDKLQGAPVGELYKAYNYDTKDVIALLLLPEELRNFGERERESALHDLRATAQAKLTHHSLVHVLHVGAWQGRYYVELEFVKGNPLTKYVKDKGPLSPSSAAHLLRCLAEALDVAHSRYVIHRAVSPHCILMMEDDEPKLGHFGIARLVSGLRKRLGRTAEKLIAKDALPHDAYLSPEQREGFPGDERSDIFGLGATLYYMLKATHPTDQKALSGPNKEAPPIFDLVRRMMNPDPRKRIQSCEAVLLALDELGLSPRHKPESRPQVTLPPEVGGDPSDTLLWDTKQLEVLRTKWGEEKAAPEFQERAELPPEQKPPAPGEDQIAREIVGGYQPAFQPYEVPESALPSAPKKSFEERGKELALARRRANIQLVFGIALNLVLFLIALRLALPLIERYMGTSEPEIIQTGPREYGKPSEPRLSTDRPTPIPREPESTTGPLQSKKEAPSESVKPLPKPEVDTEKPKPDKPEVEQPKPKQKLTPPTESDSPSLKHEDKENPQAVEKDPMKSDLMKDEPYSYYQPADWAKKGRNTVRIVIPDWHKKKPGSSDETKEEQQKAKKNTKPTPPPSEEAP